MDYKYILLILISAIKMSDSQFDYNICHTENNQKDERTFHECRIAYMEILRERDRRVGNGFPSLDNPRPISNKRNKRSVFNENDDRIVDLNAIKEFIKKCDEVDYKTEDCDESVRQEIYLYISNLQNGLETNEGSSLLLNCLLFIDFAFYHNLKEITQDESMDFLNTISSINWNVEIIDEYQFDSILYHITQTITNINYKFKSEEISEFIIVFLENSYNNILKWKLKKSVLFAITKCLKTMIDALETSNDVTKNKIYSLFIFLNNIFSNNIFWQEHYELLKIYNYFYFLKYIPSTDLVLFDNDIYKKIEPNSIFHSKFILKFEGFDLEVFLEKDLPTDWIMSELKEVYFKFRTIFGGLLSKVNGQKLTLRIFKNKKSYKKYANVLFGISTSNGGVTMPWQDNISFFCYEENGVVRNLGHEFVHSLGFLYFKTHNNEPDVLIEGLAEAIGQTSISQINQNYDEMKKLTITKELVLKSSYTSLPTCYPYGMVLIKSIIEKHEIQKLYNVLNDYKKKDFEKMVESHLENMNRMVTNYDINTNYEKVVIKELKYYRDVYTEIFLEEGLSVETDNTIFYFEKNTILMNYSDKRKQKKSFDLFKEDRIQDIRYVISKVVDLSPKFIEGYELIYNRPEIYEKDLIFYKNGVVMTLDKEMVKIINLFFSMAIKLDIKYIEENSFEEIKNKIYEKKYFSNIQYPEIIIPNDKLSFEEMCLVYDIQTAEYIDMKKVKEIDEKKILTKNNKNIKELFEIVFRENFYETKNLVGLRRKRDMNYLDKNYSLDSIDLIFDKQTSKNKKEEYSEYQKEESRRQQEEELRKRREEESRRRHEEESRRRQEEETRRRQEEETRKRQEEKNLNKLEKMPGKVNLEIKTKIEDLDGKILEVQNSLKKIGEALNKNQNIITERKIDFLSENFQLFLENDAANNNKINDHINKINGELRTIKNNVNDVILTERSLTSNLKNVIDKNNVNENLLSEKIVSVGNNVIDLLEKNNVELDEKIRNKFSFFGIEEKLKNLHTNIVKKESDTNQLLLKMNKFLDDKIIENNNKDLDTDIIRPVRTIENSEDKINYSFFTSNLFIGIVTVIILLCIVFLVLFLKTKSKTNSNKKYLESLQHLSP